MNNPDKIIFQIISRYIDLETNKLNKNISIENTPEWDSIAHMQIVSELSKIYNFELNPENIMNLNSFSSIKDYLQKL